VPNPNSYLGELQLLQTRYLAIAYRLHICCCAAYTICQGHL